MKGILQMIGIIVMITFLTSGCVKPGKPSGTIESEDEFQSAVVNVTILQEEGGRVSWLHAENLIAFDKTGEDGYTDIFVTSLHGLHTECLACDNPGVPQSHNGNPAWHPSGQYLVFQAEDPTLQGFSAPAGLEKYVTSPGMGINNNIWVMTADGSKCWQLTHVKDHYGALHPHFSPDGTYLLWSEIISPQMDKIGHWAIKLANFSTENGLTLENIRTLQPENLQLYEVHGFSSDGEKILFSGVEEGRYYYDMEIYTMDLHTGGVTQLTDNDEWDEHAHFAPDGRIVWVSSEGIPQPKGDSLQDTIANPPKLDYWIMNEDGSHKYRLSGFNHPDAPEYVAVPGSIGLGDFDWGPDGRMVAKMRRGYEEVIVLIEFDLERGIGMCCFCTMGYYGHSLPLGITILGYWSLAYISLIVYILQNRTQSLYGSLH